jgi:rhodanese-related sulfurtransferase
LTPSFILIIIIPVGVIKNNTKMIESTPKKRREIVMEYVNYIVIGLFVLFIVQRMLPTKGVKNISTSELKNELKDKNKQFVDVRTPGEFKGNHIKGFKNIPLQQLAQKAEKELSKDKEVIVFCQSGMRSKNATKVLKKLGFTNITNVQGGMSAWS